ncbi:MAG: PilZ domain-containing protein [Gammaproteobacteria bacterium]
MAGPDINEEQNRAEHPAFERPDEDELEQLARRQRIVRGVVHESALTSAGTRLDGTSGVAPSRVTHPPSVHQHDTHAPRVMAPARMPTTTPAGRQERVSMYDQDLQSLADTRNLQRGVVPTPGIDLQAQVAPNVVTDGSLRAYAVGVRKISNAGIILKVPAAVHSALAPHDELWLTLKLPSRPQPVRIATHVRHRLSDGTDYVYGCEFDWSGTFDPLGIAEDLLDFVLESGAD